MKESALLRPLRFRFTEPADVQQFGGDWHVYDEAQFIRLPARQLVLLEMALGMPLLTVLQGVRDESVMGLLGGSWLALRVKDPDLAGDFDAYTPVVMLIEWDRIPDDEPPKADMAGPLDRPEDSATSPSSPPPE